MANVLNKRFPREFRRNFGKYFGIFLLMAGVIAFISGFLLAASSIIEMNNGMHERYTVEDGNFTTSFEASDDALEAVEDLGVTVKENFYRETIMDVPSSSDQDSNTPITLRIYKTRTDFDKTIVAEGNLPQGENEVALDRVFCANHNIKLGDTVTIDGRAVTVSAICTNADYTSLFSDNSSFIFNAVSFCVGVGDESFYDSLQDAKTNYNYAFFFNEPADLVERTNTEEDIAEALTDNDATVSQLVDWESNQSITYAGEDAEGDSMMYIALLLILIAVMGFVFVILTSSTIDEESSVIGTLLASGYRKSELLMHYLTMPTLVGLAACVVGNVLGYACFVHPMKNLYYNSYSYPPFELHWSWSIFTITTIIPFALLVGITAIGLARKLRCTPQEFLRHEISHREKGRGVRLSPKIPFRSRFRIRILLKNIPNFITLFVGCFLGGVLLLFAFCLIPTIENYASLMKESMPAEHLYTLKAPLELEGSESQREAYAAALSLNNEESYDEMSGMELITALAKSSAINEEDNPVNTQENSAEAIDQAEKYAVTTLELPRAFGGESEEVTVYGISEDSRYWSDVDVSSNKVVFGAGLQDKCAVESQVVQTLYDKYSGDSYDLTPSGFCGELTNTNIYMSLDQFNQIFDEDADYFNGYASDMELNLDSDYVASDMGPEDMESIAIQMRDSMGEIAGLMLYLAVFIYIVLMYLLTKTVIDSSARSISYMKVFGYSNREINSYYVNAITIAVVLSLLISLPVVSVLIVALVKVVFMFYSGNFVIQINPFDLAKIVLVGMASYAAVAVLHIRRIKRIPLSIALKVEG